jgi:hypothetical protein
MLIIVPYRDRVAHLEIFLDHMFVYNPRANIVIVEQADDKPFNRGKLLNIGFIEYFGDSHYCFHDVDKLPIFVSYDPRPGITQLASSDIQKKDYLGGVTMFNSTVFELLGGYHNDYFHRAEDNEMMFNIKRSRFQVKNSFGRFKDLPHPRTGIEFDPVLWRKAMEPRLFHDQLARCRYEVLEKSPTHLKVLL